MMSATILHEAEVEIWDAVAYYEDKYPGLGLDFEAEVERSVDTVKRFPERRPLREDGTRTSRIAFLIWLSTCISASTSGSLPLPTASAGPDIGETESKQQNNRGSKRSAFCIN